MLTLPFSLLFFYGLYTILRWADPDGLYGEEKPARMVLAGIMYAAIGWLGTLAVGVWSLLNG